VGVEPFDKSTAQFHPRKEVAAAANSSSSSAGLRLRLRRAGTSFSQARRKAAYLPSSNSPACCGFTAVGGASRPRCA
jgi:hypothetical protein